MQLSAHGGTPAAADFDHSLSGSQQLMHVLILNGAAHGDLELRAFVDREHNALERRGLEVLRHDLADEALAYCRGCFECWVKTPGLCRTYDGANDISSQFIQSSVVLMISPIAFGGYGPELKKALDRNIGLMSPYFQKVAGETQHRQRYARYPALVGVGFQAKRDAEETAVFRALFARHALHFNAPLRACRVALRGGRPTSVSDTVLAFATRIERAA